jgi:hypothetical protein
MRRSFAVLAVLLLVGAIATAANRTDPGFVGRPGGPPTDAGTDECPGTPITGPLPYADSGDTCAGTNGITSYTGTCTLPYPYGGEDLIYEIALGAGNNVGFSADLTGSAGDLALFLISTCGNGASCVVNSQDAIGPGAGPEEILPASYPPATYYLYVDSYYDAGTPGSCGTYNLTVTGTVPVELIEFTAS